MKYNNQLNINGRVISNTSPTYFIADIAANHDGELERAKSLIWMAKEAGADCAKFQHFKANKIVSNVGFSGSFSKVSHQSNWKKSVVEIYDQYHTRREWNLTLVEECKKANIDFMTTPYDSEAIEELDNFLSGYKIGSGDITFTGLIKHIASKNKPVFLATGASTFKDVEKALNIILAFNKNICLMQCNTNYTGSMENFRYINLNVLKTFRSKWPNIILGLSDHTPGHTTVISAVTLGCRVIEKHFTDNNERIGPDHSFAMNPKTWSEMVRATQEVELALGDGIKRVEYNEQETVIIQRRALRINKSLKAGSTIKNEDLVALRPCPHDAITPNSIDKVIGKELIVDILQEEHLKWKMLK